MKNKNTLSWILLLAVSPISAWAQEGTKSASYFSNALFNALLLAIILLLILVVALSSAIRNIIESDFFRERYKKSKEARGTKSLGLFFLILLATEMHAQVKTAASAGVGGIDTFTFYFMLSLIALELIVIVLLFNVLRTYTRNELNAAGELKAAPVKAERSIIDVLNASVDVEKEADIMLDHDYDGIKELDNNLPPWWKYGFYLTIICAFIYMIHFHISKTGKLQLEEYDKEMTTAKLEVEEFMRTSATNVDETSVKYLKETADLEAGKTVFVANCVACHGKGGEGNTVGPNLTDKYWLHGGSMVDIFKTVKYGWTDKGMKSWKEDLSPMQMAQVSSFIKSLVGTNPPNGKGPQGEEYVEGPAVVADSTAAAITPTAVVQDTLKKN